MRGIFSRLSVMENLIHNIQRLNRFIISIISRTFAQICKRIILFKVSKIDLCIFSALHTQASKILIHQIRLTASRHSTYKCLAIGFCRYIRCYWNFICIPVPSVIIITYQQIIRTCHHTTHPF